MTKIVFEKVLPSMEDLKVRSGFTLDSVYFEDSRRALVAEFQEDDRASGIFIRLQSWSDSIDHEEPSHPEMEKLMGRKVRITVEAVDE